ncbi:MAG TPA: LuxR C-terminal-related transcriptional regulator [Gammaproteobacteria bacterium]
MDNSDIARISHFLLELYRNAQQMEPGRFQQDMLQQLGQLLDFDYAVWGGAQAAERQITDLVVLNQSPELLIRWQEVGQQDSFCDLTLRHLNRSWMFDDVLNYRNTLAYNEHWRTFDVRHMISTIMQEPMDGYVSFIGLCNVDPSRPFSEHERQIKQLLMPHLSEALRLNRQQTLDLSTEDNEGTALASPQGWILASSAPFAALLQEEWGSAIRRLPATLFDDTATYGDWCGRRIIIQFRRFSGHLLLRARPLTPLDRLSPRAQEVAQLYAGGLSHKEVARQLGISPETVRKHLVRIYAQLGIASKASLARLVSLGGRATKREF